jgi:hypothetical protein
MLSVYKYVQRDGNKFCSVGNPNFKYELNQYTVAELTNKYSGIYCFNRNGVNGVSKDTKRDFILLELHVTEDDFIRDEGLKVSVFRGVTPIREVLREEYERW